MKLVFPMSWSVAQLAWSMVDGEDMLKRGTFDGKSNWHWAMRTLEHGLSFLFRCHLTFGSFVAQVRKLVNLMTLMTLVTVMTLPACSMGACENA
jgi:hypothetical protein